MKVPKIKTEFVNSVNERVKIIIEETLACLKAVYDFQSSSTTLDTVGTYSTLFNKYYRALYKVHNHEARTLYSHFMMLSELSSCKDKSEDKLYQILEKKIVTSPPDSDSMFVRDSDLAVTAAERAASFIVPNVFAGNVDAHYNLRYLQLEQLRDAIYHYDPGWRLEARVNLLASLPGHLRSEVINQPLRILTHALREHLFSRDEILHFFFPRYLRGNRGTQTTTCICCEQVFHFKTPQSIRHMNCILVNTLVHEYQLKYHDCVLSVQQFIFVRSGISEYFRSILQARQRESTGLISQIKTWGATAFRRRGDGAFDRVIKSGPDDIYSSRS